MKDSKKIKFSFLIIVVICIVVNILGCMISAMYWSSWFLFGLSVITLGVFTYYIIRKLSYLNYIIEGSKRIKEGDINYKLELVGNDNFTYLAENINNIGEGLGNAIGNQLKSERMKSELITNVSHDLKTPLTSIINYIELIKNDEDMLQPEHIKDYIHVLDNKSKKLKLLIEDLFEASRASSGNLELNIEKIELSQILRQSIGEVEEKLLDLGLDIKLNMPEDKVYVNADGRRLYRVLESLLSNISKYSLNNTRIYIDIGISNKIVILTMKNISSYELNFDPNELMERFKRADESRNTEGNGLGLAIARDLVSLQGGKFYVDIDGDLFKVRLEFPSVDK
ncbi:sensor histidine kinase [Romboutsia weinsteinii]|uniref:histidine kinase n=1 Tax=Romboutsia weinsteinii TaxID=2020949 RepID=A0A255ILQ9_9FIRM|nr:sensor histidine kinase [Romboutsia weinsteinii]RDY28908.1 sensor histidine kinase [Romboutsia weinsteinii]